jgi:hypothetical protein
MLFIDHRQHRRDVIFASCKRRLRPAESKEAHHNYCNCEAKIFQFHDYFSDVVFAFREANQCEDSDFAD